MALSLIKNWLYSAERERARCGHAVEVVRRVHRRATILSRVLSYAAFGAALVMIRIQDEPLPILAYPGFEWVLVLAGLAICFGYHAGRIEIVLRALELMPADTVTELDDDRTA
jgi:hypothetical protein